MNRLVDKQHKDLRPLAIILAGVLLVVLKLVLCSSQRMFLWPEEAVLDDNVMYDGAVAITRGEWLGDYGWKTLSKHSFFSLWLAVLHWLNVPYLMGGQLLWAAAALAGAWAMAPAFGRRWPRLFLFAVLLFNPASVANPAPNGFVLRAYRDNIFPALCLLCVAGVVGYALRYAGRLRQNVGWLVVAGLGLAACRLTREDGWWLLPFVLAAAGITLVFILRDETLRGSAKAKLLRCLALVLPLVVLAAGELSWRAANSAVYGRFILSDFSEGEFADAYGAMTRIEHEDWQPKIGVPYDVRRQLYDNVPAFAPLEQYLESEGYHSRYAGSGDYDSGSFYFALREAAAAAGYYDTPKAAQAYFAGLAADINALCDAGVLQAGAARSAVSPPIRAEYVAPVLKEAAYSLWFCATFQQCDARPLFSPHANDPGFYAETIQPMEEFLHDSAQTVTVENSDAPYFTFFQNLAFKAFDALRMVYAVLLPAALVLAAAWQLWEGVRMVRRLRQKQRRTAAAMLWWVQLGLLCCILLRALMIAFVMVSSFSIPTYVMYLASIHPLMLVYGVVGAAQLGALVWQRRAGRPRTAARA